MFEAFRSQRLLDLHDLSEGSAELALRWWLARQSVQAMKGEVMKGIFIREIRRFEER